MNRTAFFRHLSLAVGTLSVAMGSLAAGPDDRALDAARFMATSDDHVAVQLQGWVDRRDLTLAAMGEALITNEMRAAAAQHAVALEMEADGLLSATLRAEIARVVHARALAQRDALSAAAAPVLTAGGR